MDGPVLSAPNICYELAEKTKAIAHGGIGAIHRLVQRVGLATRIDTDVRVLKVHQPYYESDHVLNIAYNLLCGGQTLDDIELRRTDRVFLDARLAGVVAVDETFIGGEEPGLAGGRARGKKVLTGIAVEVREPNGFGRCRMRPLADASAESLHPFVTDHVEPSATVITDGSGSAEGRRRRAAGPCLAALWRSRAHRRAHQRWIHDRGHVRGGVAAPGRTDLI